MISSSKKRKHTRARASSKSTGAARIRCSESQASLFSRLFFGWVTPLIAHGWSVPVQPESLPRIGINNEMDTTAIADKFEKEWTQEIQRTSSASTGSFNSCLRFVTWPFTVLWGYMRRRQLSPPVVRPASPTPSLLLPLCRLVSWHLVCALTARLVTELIPVFIPILVKLTTTFAQQKRLAAKHALAATAIPAGITNPPNWQGYVLVVAMFAMLLLYSWSFQWFFFKVGKATIIVRSALISAVYRKSLVLSAQARSRLTLGRLTNLVSSDISQVERGVTNAIVCITIPVQVIASIIVLVYMIGPSGIAGWAVVIGFVPIQLWASRYLVRLRGQAIRYTDQRIRATREAIQGIKVVKAFAWEQSILETMQHVRSKEVGVIARLNLLRYTLISLALHSPAFASILTFAVFVLTGGKLKNGPVFATIGIFNSMSVPLSWFPGALTETRNMLVPLRRIAEALLEEELNHTPEPQLDLDVAIRVSGGTFEWGSSSEGIAPSEDNTAPPDADYNVSQTTFHLQNIDLEIPHGSLVMVIGTVGSGKSSLASALVGEMDCISGTVVYGGTLAYASQVPWMMNATIRENIVFGLPFNAERYRTVVEACELEEDLIYMPAGDQTEIGERGVTLSGGQKQRISIARAAYAECAISILDDCLSAVDAKTSRAIFKQCLRGVLADTTRIIVTNNLEYLPAADLVVTMDNGQISECGTFSNLIDLDGVTAALYKSFTNSASTEHLETDRVYTTDSSLHTATPIRASAASSHNLVQWHPLNCGAEKQSALTFASLAVQTEISELIDLESSSSGGGSTEQASSSDKSIEKAYIAGTAKCPLNAIAPAGKLMSQEDREIGQISWATYYNYIRAGGGFTLLTATVLCLAISQGCRIGSDFWMRLWIRHQHNPVRTNIYIGLYALLGSLQFFWFGLFAGLLTLSVFKGSKRLHEQAFSRVLGSPMWFFDTTPLGRILNRFTRDVDSLDLAVCDFFRQFYQNIARSIGAFVSISILVPIFLVPLVPLFVASWALIYVYLRTSVEIQRAAAISRSPLYAHYTETLQGLATIRAYKAQHRYIAQADRVLDAANRPHWYSLAVQSWVWLRVDYLSHLLTLIICLVIVAQPARWDAAAVGLMLVQATQMGAYVTYAGRGWSELQNNMNSVERISHYAAKLEQEPSGQTSCGAHPDTKLTAITARPITASWPERGTVIIRNLSMCYRPGLPLALRDLDMEVYGGERVGIVGRSGAGKSSLVAALFRLTEPTGGKVFIDGIDTQIVPLNRLRKSIGILPQDPVLFAGSVRTNLDPFHEFSDSDIWDMLRQVRLYSLVSQHPQKLDMPVGEGGDNFSAGQRQLLCLARALLRKPRILVLDEATANVDHETDAAIQRIIAEQHGMSVLSIAHRLQTVIAYDRIYVIDGGQVVESGAPLALLEQYVQADADMAIALRQQSPFYRMIHEMDSAAVESLLALARAGGRQRHE